MDISDQRTLTHNVEVSGQLGECVIHRVEEDVILGDQHRGVELNDGLVHAYPQLIFLVRPQLQPLDVPALRDPKVDAAIVTCNITRLLISQ